MWIAIAATMSHVGEETNTYWMQVQVVARQQQDNLIITIIPYSK